MTSNRDRTLLRSLRDAGLEKCADVNLGNIINTPRQYASFMPDQFYSTAPRFYAHDVRARAGSRRAECVL